MIKFAYDTLGTSKELEAAGMERNQAEAVAIAIAQREGNLATKSDIDGVKSDIDGVKSDIDGVKSDLNALRTEVKSDINAVKSDINALRTEVKSDLNALRTEVKSDLNALRTEVKSDMKSQFRWMMSMQIVTFLAILALVFANGL